MLQRNEVTTAGEDDLDGDGSGDSGGRTMVPVSTSDRYSAPLLLWAAAAISTIIKAGFS